ncbi:aminopeptidase N-like [Pogonomyrmex barbatus]|uniref:Aminopeptidase n=1 Tax=Pogonomyrmex barbatus TaxID=144034 RepID=A0A6I9WCL2_9HYME|nr:aminopeptidase N-like [Pogonomyrmex barbatus]
MLHAVDAILISSGSSIYSLILIISMQRNDRFVSLVKGSTHHCISIMAAIKNLLILILIFAIGNCVPLQDDEVVENSEGLEFRLPKNIIPIHYDIKLITHFEDNFTTNGEVNIDIKVHEPTNTIALHALNLTIHESLTEITRKGVNNVNSKSKYIPKQHKYDELTQILTLQFEEPLDSEMYMLRINFDGIILLNNWMRGFYKDFYTDNKGNDVLLALTHLQPTFARQVFPCWDEPAIKATFKFSIKHYPNYTALSNMPSTRPEVDASDGKLWTYFETTPIMSTNLLGFVISDYDHISNLDGTIKIWGPKHLLPHATFSLDIIEKATQELEKFTNSTVHVPKMDHVSIPHYSSRATENWGMIVYHEYSSTTPDDLWKTLQDALNESDIPHDDFKVKEVMDTWFEQGGYPFVTVNRDYVTGEIKVTQEICEIKKADRQKNESWWIPLNFATESNLDFSSTLATHWLKPHEDLTIEGVDTNDWIIVNKHLTGFYRVNYDDTNWKRIAAFLNSDNYDKIPVLNRAQILDDAFFMLKTERLDPVIFVKIMNYLSRETDTIPWIKAFHIIGNFEKYMEIPKGIAILKPFLSHLVHKLFEYIDFDENPDDDVSTIYVRTYLYNYDCMYDLSECRIKATAKVLAYIEDPIANKLSPNQEEMYCFGLMKANESIWDQFLQIQYETSKSHRTVFGCTENLHIIEKHLDSTVNTENDINFYLLNLRNVDIAIELFINKYEKFKDAKNEILSDIIMKSSKQEQIDKIKAFAEQHSIDIKEYLDRRENYLTVLNNHLQQIQSILENALDGIN